MSFQPDRAAELGYESAADFAFRKWAEQAIHDNASRFSKRKHTRQCRANFICISNHERYPCNCNYSLKEKAKHEQSPSSSALVARTRREQEHLHR